VGWTLLREMESRFQADLWTQALAAEGLDARLRTWEDTAYDGLFVGQRGWGWLYVDEADLARARVIDAELERSLAEGSALAVPSPQALAKCIDHTLLEAGAGRAELARHLEQCLTMGAAAACVLPWMVPEAARVLAGSGVAVCTVVDFPLGAGLAEDKLAQARAALAAGATELDVVINRGLVASGQEDEAVAEVAQVAGIVAQALPGAQPEAMVKVILETPKLGPAASARLAQKFAATPVRCLKTGTGFFGPATVDDVRLLKQAGGPAMLVKAAGGIGDLPQALALLAAGADRLGASAGFRLWREARSGLER
jgi:deoxyribose-phosphate aldolase